MPDTKAHPLVTKEVMEQYEKIRRTDRVNMHDRDAVYTLASNLKFRELAYLIQEDSALSARGSVYIFQVIKRYDFYMKKFKLTK
jgi:hypothetical protein